MTAHEDAIEAGAQALHGDECPDDEHDLCDVGAWDRTAAAVVDAVEPIIRDDERERIGNNDRLHAEWQQYAAYAEAVAARLVEVICEDAAVEEMLCRALSYWRHVQADLDAARAEVAALREQPCAHDMTIHDEKVCRQVLADLRAKVPQLPLWGTGLIRVSDVTALLGGDS